MSQYFRKMGKSFPMVTYHSTNSDLLEQMICTTIHFEPLRQKSLAEKRQITRILLENNCSLPQAMFLKDPIITELMLDAGCSLDDRDPENGFTALHYTVQNTDVNNMKLQLERGSDI